MNRACRWNGCNGFIKPFVGFAVDDAHRVDCVRRPSRREADLGTASMDYGCCDLFGYVQRKR
jgi:hypothetical protein